MQSLVRDDIVKQLSILAELHYQKQFALRLDDLVELDDVWVSDLLKNFDLPTDPLDIFLILNPGLFEYFNCNL